MPPETHDFGARYGGRLVKVEIYVNTDEDPEKLAKRCRRAARGIKLNAAVVTLALYEGPEARAAWSAIAQFAAKAHADPNAKPFSDADDPEAP